MTSEYNNFLDIVQNRHLGVFTDADKDFLFNFHQVNEFKINIKGIFKNHSTNTTKKIADSVKIKLTANEQCELVSVQESIK